MALLRQLDALESAGAGDVTQMVVRPPPLLAISLPSADRAMIRPARGSGLGQPLVSGCGGKAQFTQHHPVVRGVVADAIRLHGGRRDDVETLRGRDPGCDRRGRSTRTAAGWCQPWSRARAWCPAPRRTSRRGRWASRHAAGCRRSRQGHRLRAVPGQSRRRRPSWPRWSAPDARWAAARDPGRSRRRACPARAATRRAAARALRLDAEASRHRDRQASRHVSSPRATARSRPMQWRQARKVARSVGARTSVSWSMRMRGHGRGPVSDAIGFSAGRAGTRRNSQVQKC